MNKYPFSVDNDSEYIKISKSGFYQIIYNDYYFSRSNDTVFVLYDETNNKDLVRNKLLIGFKSGFTHYSLNAVFQINLKDGQDHNEISIFLETISTTTRLYGSNFASFYIKYLHD